MEKQKEIRTTQGKIALNNKIAEMVNDRIRPRHPMKSEHIKLYKKCKLDEYTERTGKCIWGFQEMRKRLGYDPQTGYEL